MHNDLPDFEKRKVHEVMPYITRILSSGNGSSLLKLIASDDGHFRAVFKSTYFVLQGDRTEPSKSQWSTLKKKMKRHDGRVFIFREYGKLDCEEVADNTGANRDYDCYYLDFGFFAY